MKFHLTIIFLLITPFLFAQNLVPNPSFEEYINCPYNYFMLPTDWYSCSATPDYFNVCDTTGNYSVPNNGGGFQNAHTGNAYAGLYSVYNGFASGEYKEYLGCKLITNLIPGEKYYVTFWANLFDIANCASNNIGILFTTQSYQDYQPYDTIWGRPTINFAHVNSTSIIANKVNWTCIKSEFVADSAYQYVLIGNFFDKNHTDTVMYNNYPCYAFYYIDDVCVSTDSSTCNSPDAINEMMHKENIISIYPDPATNELTIDFTMTDKCYFELYDLLGAKRKTVTLDSGSKTKTIDLTDFDSGLYFYSVVDSKGNRIKSGKLIVIK
jgi:hypothetical protein